MTVGVWFDFGHTKCQWEVDGTTRKKGPDGHGRDKKPESWMAVLDPVVFVCFPSGLFSSLSLQTTAHFLFPNRPDVFKDRWVNQDFFLFLNGAQVCHWNWRSSQSGFETKR